MTNDPGKETRAIGRMLARELDSSEIERVAGGNENELVSLTGSTTFTWTPRKDDIDNDPDCDEPGADGSPTLEP